MQGEVNGDERNKISSLGENRTSILELEERHFGQVEKFDSKTRLSRFGHFCRIQLVLHPICQC